MPSLSFQKQFIPAIRAMLSKDYAIRHKLKPKNTTIRAMRKRPFRKGDRLILFSGLRTKSCEKLGEVRCKKVEDIQILHVGEALFIVVVNGKMITDDAIRLMARQDGFKDGADMIRWFAKNHGFPFHGQRIFMDNTYDRKFYLHKKTKDLGLKVKLTKLEKTIEITSEEVEKVKGDKYISELTGKYQYGIQIINPLFR